MNPTKLFYCTICEAETDHEISVDGNGEFLVTCPVCKHFIKLPSSTQASDFDDYAKAHKENNEGQVSLAAQEKVIESLKKEVGDKKSKPEKPEEKPTT